MTVLTAGCCPGSAAGSVVSAIPPGQSCEVPFEFDLRNSCAETGPRSLREVKLQLPVAVEPADAAPTAPWVLRGRVRAAVSVPVRSIDFGRETPSAAAPPRAVSIRALTDLSQLTAAVDGQGVTAELRESPEPRTWELIVGKAAGLPVGKYRAEVKLCPVTRTGEPASPVRIPVEFEIIHDVQPDTPVAVLGQCPIGGVAEGRVTLSSLSGRPFRVTGWAAEPATGLEVTAGDDKSAPSQSFSVRQRLTAPGDNAGRLRFDGVDADGMPFAVWVEVRSFGTSDQ